MTTRRGGIGRRWGWLLLLSMLPAVAFTQSTPAAPHIVLVGDSTVTEGSGWGLGFRQLVDGARVTNTARNGHSSQSFGDEGHWDKAIALKGDYYLIQFGHNDQPGKGAERETDSATTFPANMARYVDEVRAIGATPILVTSLVRRTFSESRPMELVSTLGPWVEAVKRVAAEKRVLLIDLDASSRALCERLGPVQTAGFNIRKDDGSWDTTHLDATGSAAFARLVVDELRQGVPALAPVLAAEIAAPVVDDPADLPPPHALLSFPDAKGGRSAFGRVYTRSIRLARIHQRAAFHGREPDLKTLPAPVTSVAILVAWEFVPWSPPDGVVDCGFGPLAPRAIGLRALRDPAAPPYLEPVAFVAEPERIRELLEPFETDVRRVRWVAVLDPARLRPPSALVWRATKPCPTIEDGYGMSETAVLIAPEDIDRWRDRSPPPSR